MIQKGYVTLPAGQIHYRFVDGEGPRVILLHRTAASSAMYENLLIALAGRYQAYALDTPGFGASFDPVGWPAMTDYASWLAGALDALDIAQAHLFGHHTGANIAVQLAREYPEKVASLMLMGVTYLTFDEREELRPAFETVFEPREDGSHLQQNWDWVNLLAVTDDALPAMHQEFLDTTRAYVGRVQAFSAVWDQDLPFLLEQVKQPLLLMCAEDEMLYRYFPRMLEAIPRARTATFTGGTFAPELDSVRIAASIDGFVAGIGG
jgi:pimeloyl-ACP methyl ester carboxylesterase